MQHTTESWKPWNHVHCPACHCGLRCPWIWARPLPDSWKACNQQQNEVD